MTFKHSNFSSSETMRSLVRVYQEKGMLKEDPLEKIASAASIKSAMPNLNVSDNLTDNILKLCSGLRSKGLSKHADELESNFLAYKQAQTLYNTHNEDGDDLVHAAHPKGSHKLENVDSDEAVVEDILDKHKKIVDVVNKKPTGKLSTADVINAVKVVLGKMYYGSSLEDSFEYSLEDLVKKYQESSLEDLVKKKDSNTGVIISSLKRLDELIDKDENILSESVSKDYQEKRSSVDAAIKTAINNPFPTVEDWNMVRLLAPGPFDTIEPKPFSRSFNPFSESGKSSHVSEEIWHVVESEQLQDKIKKAALENMKLVRVIKIKKVTQSTSQKTQPISDTKQSTVNQSTISSQDQAKQILSTLTSYKSAFEKATEQQVSSDNKTKILAILSPYIAKFSNPANITPGDIDKGNQLIAAIKNMTSKK